MLTSMEPPKPASEPEASPSTVANPVMDVVAPPPAEITDNAEQTSLSPDPVDKLVAEDKEVQKALEKKPVTKKPATKQTSSTGVGLAIFATIVIVLSLAALATYAYLQTAK